MKNDYYRFIPPNLVSKVPEIFRNEVKDITMCRQIKKQTI